jgi:hypothetical protein
MGYICLYKCGERGAADAVVVKKAEKIKEK